MTRRGQEDSTRWDLRAIGVLYSGAGGGHGWQLNVLYGAQVGRVKSDWTMLDGIKRVSVLVTFNCQCDVALCHQRGRP